MNTLNIMFAVTTWPDVALASISGLTICGMFYIMNR